MNNSSIYQLHIDTLKYTGIYLCAITVRNNSYTLVSDIFCIIQNEVLLLSSLNNKLILCEELP